MAPHNKKDKKFDFDKLSMRELQAFLIILQYEGERLHFIKMEIDKMAKHKSRTKGYDYINGLCQKGFVYKEKNPTRIFIYPDIRKQYEKLILPTLSSIKESFDAQLNDYIEEYADTQKIREKFSNYTDTLKNSVTKILKSSPIKERDYRRLQKKIFGEFEDNLKVELVKHQLFSE